MEQFLTVLGSIVLGWFLHELYDEWKEDEQFWKEQHEWEAKRKGIKVA